jgi:hypothetical protein
VVEVWWLNKNALTECLPWDWCDLRFDACRLCHDMLRMNEPVGEAGSSFGPKPSGRPGTTWHLMGGVRVRLESTS